MIAVDRDNKPKIQDLSIEAPRVGVETHFDPKKDFSDGHWEKISEEICRQFIRASLPREVNQPTLPNLFFSFVAFPQLTKSLVDDMPEEKEEVKNHILKKKAPAEQILNWVAIKLLLPDQFTGVVSEIDESFEDVKQYVVGCLQSDPVAGTYASYNGSYPFAVTAACLVYPERRNELIKAEFVDKQKERITTSQEEFIDYYNEEDPKSSNYSLAIATASELVVLSAHFRLIAPQHYQEVTFSKTCWAALKDIMTRTATKEDKGFDFLDIASCLTILAADEVKIAATDVKLVVGKDAFSKEEEPKLPTFRKF